MPLQIKQENDRIYLVGAVGFANVESCLRDIIALLRKQEFQHIQINFEQLQHQDGSIIALMTSLLRQARTLGIKVSYISVPDHILRISQLYGVRTILPIVV